MSTGELLLLITGSALGVITLWRAVALRLLRRLYGSDTSLGFVRLCSDIWCRLAHRVSVEGRSHLQQAEGCPDGNEEGVLIVANHTGAIDPFLIQVPGRRLIHWMMASDMMLPLLDDLWELVRVVPVNRTKPDASSLRRAMRLLRDGEVVGLFPEGRITRPPGTIRPFQEGVGLLATRCGATVLPVLVSGTPDTDSTPGSMLGPSRSHVRFLAPMQFDKRTSPQEAAEEIRRVMAEAAGWALCDTPMPLDLGWSE
ncbi:MAG: 1-acyl-sn-glycerol-3-phosphate acyltransferase [Phycisphaerales bacterium]|nr:1-acyl-sn-glycerol-3-phosphate acyltransferase [Phycisphaerales bacterium]